MMTRSFIGREGSGRPAASSARRHHRRHGRGVFLEEPAPRRDRLPQLTRYGSSASSSAAPSSSMHARGSVSVRATVSTSPKMLFSPTPGGLLEEIHERVRGPLMIDERAPADDRVAEMATDALHDDPTPDVIEATEGLAISHGREIHQAGDLPAKGEVHAGHREELVGRHHPCGGITDADGVRSDRQRGDRIEIGRSAPEAHAHLHVTQNAAVAIWDAPHPEARNGCRPRGRANRLAR